MSHSTHKFLPVIPVFHTNTSLTHSTEGAIGVAFHDFNFGFQWFTTFGSPGDIQGVIGCQVCDQTRQFSRLGEEDAGKGGGDGEG